MYRTIYEKIYINDLRIADIWVKKTYRKSTDKGKMLV